MALIATGTTNVGRWPLGMTEYFQVDTDGLVRTVNVHVASGILRRDRRQLCLLEGVD